MSDVDDIKTRLDIVEYINKRVPLKKAGRNFKGLCPFHGEKTPSFMVSPDRQSWHCFGCGKGGSIFDFVMEYAHVDFREALEELAELAGIELTRHVAATPMDALKERLFEIHHLAQEYYQFLLISHGVGESARAYIKTRGVSEKIVKSFGLGYSPNSWDGLSKFLKKKGYTSQEMEASGLLVPSARGGYDRFRGRLMFPLKNHRGQTLGFSGRLLDPEMKEAKYINSPETVLYKKGHMLFGLDITKGAIQKEQTAILMEGEFDVISSLQAGIGNVVAIKGTAITEEHVFLLKRFAPKIIFCLDGDVAGDSASKRGIEIAEKAGLEMYVALLPEGKDPDDLARKDPVVLKKAIKDALSIYDYYFSSVQKRVAVDTAYGKKHVGDELLPIVSRIDNPIVQAHYVKKLASMLGVSQDTIADGMRKVKRTGGEKQSKPSLPQEQEHKEGENQHDMYLLTILLQSQDPHLLLQDIETTIPLEALRSVLVKAILGAMRQFLNEQGSFALNAFLSTVPPEWNGVIDQALLYDLGGIGQLPKQMHKEWQSIGRDILKRHLKDRMQTITATLKATDEENHAETAQKLSELAQKLRHLEKIMEE